jgi:hypothetical protein
MLAGKSEGNSPFERLKHRWKDDVKMDLKGIGYEDVDCIKLALNRVQERAVVNTIMNLRVS